jgi:hypothetical protein
LATQTKPTKYKCDQPGCEAEYDRPTGLGIHKLRAHGIKGSSPSVLSLRKKRKAEAQTPKRKYTKRSSELAKTETFPLPINGHANGHAPETSFGSIPEATLALALGRVQGLCTSFATEFDLPSRSFTAQLAALLYATTVQQPSRGSMRMPTL